MFALQKRHTFALPTSAKELIEITDTEQLRELRYTSDTWILGEGSNTIFAADYSGQVLVNKLRGIVIEEVDNAWLVRVAAGESWHELVAKLVREGIPGFENLALIPGSVGAAPVQNIGAYGVEIATFIDSVNVYDLKHHQQFSLTNAECEFGYRNSIFKRSEHAHWLITGVQFRLPKEWFANLSYPDLAVLPQQASARDIMEHVMQVRNTKLPNPNELANAGSFFKNPIVSKQQYAALAEQHHDMPVYPVSESHVKLAAGWLIDKAGLKALRVGDIGVHSRQALVLVNHGRGTGEQLRALAGEIIREIKRIYGVDLEPEVRVLGSSGLIAWQ